MNIIPKLSTREKAIFLAIYESDLSQEPHFVYPLPPIREQLNLLNSGKRFSLEELEAAAKHFEQLRLGGFYPQKQESAERVYPSRFQISPRGLNVAGAMLDEKQKSLGDRITGWRWWIPIAGLASTAAALLALL
ncbi:hypothetical protein [Qipengyuania flava]|uniref:hypothetical protein n=1 Tax=Qipengyuania flava TaxID=192812 RepID=UPI00141B1415|nr:hypothetical protein [Qipengyuania flava]NIJ60951.1 hypothetical protein [Qipengyuania flava]